jgi:intracellular sulfur oxidation DsrE/DsrF family protein
MQRTIIQLCLALVFVSMQSMASDPVTGPVIKSYGPVFAVPDGSFNLEPDRHYKIVMDIGSGPEDPSELNRNIETAARFLNMHSRNGIKPENLELSVVLHGSGARAALTQEAHEKHFSVPNGSRQLIEELGSAGVAIYICGQTAGYHGYGSEDLLSEVSVAVSAMTVHVRLQQEGYQAILF